MWNIFIKFCSVVFIVYTILINSFGFCDELSVQFEDKLSIGNNSILNRNGTKPVDDEQELVVNPWFGLLHTLESYGKWAVREETIVEVLTKRLELMEAENSLIKLYLEDYEESTGEALKNVKEPKNTEKERGEVIGKSAVLGHRMTHRYSTTLTDLKDLLLSSEYIENEIQINNTLELSSNENETTWVTGQDMYMSKTAFLHLEEVYQFHPEQLAKGIEVDTRSGGRLNPVHCAEIGMFALYKKRYFMAVEWLELVPILKTMDQIDNGMFLENEEQSWSDVSLDLAKVLIRVAIQEHNRAGSQPETEHTFDIISNLFNLPILEKIPPEERKTINHMELIESRKEPEPGVDLNYDARFGDLCLGNTFQSPRIQKYLNCFYENRKHPYLYINPIKTEILSKNPPVWQFYEIIGNETIKFIKNLNEDRVVPSGVVGGKEMDDVSVWRTSAGIGMPASEMPKSVYLLAEFLTGLRIRNNSDLTQYVEYTYGRFYTQHQDSFAFEENEVTTKYIERTGDRMATMLYYLELPEMGGATPFVQAGVNAIPERGSAILWYGLYRNGKARRDANHGACPVIHGHKIVMNHWIHHVGNWDKRKCSLSSFE